MSARFEDPPLTLAAFLDWERRQPERYEYVGYEIVAMAGGTLDHSRIASTLYFHLRTATATRGCEAFAENVKVVAAGQVHYPDVLVTCSPQDGRSDTASDPVLIAEVLSPSSADRDSGLKWRNYQTIPGLHTYLLIAQHRPRVECYTRGDGDSWIYRALSGLDAVLDLPALSLTLPLADLYRGVDLESGR